MEKASVWHYSRFNRRYAARSTTVRLIDRVKDRLRDLLGFATVIVAMVPVALIGIAYAAFVELIVYGG